MASRDTNRHYLKGSTVNRKPEHNPKTFGHIPDSPVGRVFQSRLECSIAGVHSPFRAGIHGNSRDGAFSVALSGGYEDDVDYGDTVIFTGHGGQNTDPGGVGHLQGKKNWSGPQGKDQEWTAGNKGLQISHERQTPVRLIRGQKAPSEYAPAEGYRYDGLYLVTKAWRGPGKTGFNTCRFTLERIPGQPRIPKKNDINFPHTGSNVGASSSVGQAATLGPSAAIQARPTPGPRLVFDQVAVPDIPYLKPRPASQEPPKHNPTPSWSDMLALAGKAPQPQAQKRGFNSIKAESDQPDTKRCRVQIGQQRVLTQMNKPVSTRATGSALPYRHKLDMKVDPNP